MRAGSVAPGAFRAGIELRWHSGPFWSADVSGPARRRPPLCSHVVRRAPGLPRHCPATPPPGGVTPAGGSTKSAASRGSRRRASSSSSKSQKSFRSGTFTGSRSAGNSDAVACRYASQGTDSIRSHSNSSPLSAAERTRGSSASESGSVTARAKTARPCVISQPRKYSKPSSEAPPLIRYAAPHRSTPVGGGEHPPLRGGRTRRSPPARARRAARPPARRPRRPLPRRWPGPGRSTARSPRSSWSAVWQSPPTRHPHPAVVAVRQHGAVRAISLPPVPYGETADRPGWADLPDGLRAALAARLGGPPAEVPGGRRRLHARLRRRADRPEGGPGVHQGGGAGRAAAPGRLVRPRGPRSWPGSPPACRCPGRAGR